MPWHMEPKKDVSRRKPRVAATSDDTWVSEWGNPYDEESYTVK